MMEAQLVLATPAQRFAFHLAPTAKVATQPLITLMTKDGMPLRVAARQPQPRVAPVDGAASPMVATRALALAA